MSVLPAESWMLRSPPHWAGSRSSLGNGSMGVRRAGLREPRPNRSSNREAPTPTMTVSPSGTTVAPRIPESDGGPVAPAGTGVPPEVRKRERVVRVRSRSVSSPRFSEVMSKASTMLCRCGGGRMPAWCTPWNGTAGNRPTGSAAPAAGDEPAARAGPTSPVTPAAAPIAPAPSTPRRKDRRPGSWTRARQWGRAGSRSLMAPAFPARR